MRSNRLPQLLILQIAAAVDGEVTVLEDAAGGRERDAQLEVAGEKEEGTQVMQTQL